MYNKIAECLGWFGFAILMVLFCGWVDMTVWNWFVPLYFHLPYASLAWMIGFSTLVNSLCVWFPVDYQTKDVSIKYVNTWAVLIKHIYILALTALVHFYFMG